MTCSCSPTFIKHLALTTCFRSYHRGNTVSSAHSLHKFPPWFCLYPASTMNNANRKFCPPSPFPKACTCCSVLGALLRYVGDAPAEPPDISLPLLTEDLITFWIKSQGSVWRRRNVSLPPKHLVCLNSSASMGKQPFTFAKILASVSSVVLPDI